VMSASRSKEYVKPSGASVWPKPGQSGAVVPAISELTWNGQAGTAIRTRTGPPGAWLAAWLAEAAAELLADPAVVASVNARPTTA
jgi:hypothetical protein